MLQLRVSSHAAQGKLTAANEFPPSWKDMYELEKITNEWICKFLRERRRVANELGIAPRLTDTLDRFLRTDRPEHIDDPEFPAKGKLKIVGALHFLNRLILSYHRYSRLLEPLIRMVAARYKRPARLLELGSGSGGFAHELARLADQKGLPVEVTGSDYIPEYVKTAANTAKKRSLNVKYILMNAFDMNNIEKDSFDIVLISQSMHHFSHGQIAMMIAQAERISTTAFVGFDGYRGLLFFSCVPLIMLFMTLSPSVLHDTILSGCKFKSEFELELISRIAVPDAQVSIKESFPGVSVLSIRFD